VNQAGFIPIVRRWWPVVLLAAVAAGVSAKIIGSTIDPTYEAEVTLLTGPINTDFGTLRASGDLARTYSDLATSGPILSGAVKKLRLGLPVEELRKDVSATSNDVTRLVKIRVRDTGPARAAAIANELARRLTNLTRGTTPQQVELLNKLREQPEFARLDEATKAAVTAAVSRLTQQPFEGRLQVVDPAAPPTTPVAPRITLITLMAALAGAIGAGIIILLAELSSARVEGDEAGADVAGIPLLASIGAGGWLSARKPTGLIVEEAPNSDAARDYQLLATKIGLLADWRPTRSLLVIGSEDRAGGGIVAANLAAVLAHSAGGAALVDANESQPEITRMLGLDDAPGLGELLSSNGSGPSLKGLGVDRGEGLLVLPRGDEAVQGLIGPEQASQALDLLLEESGRVVINAASVEHSPSTLIWAHVADATVLVIRPRSKREAVAEAERALRLAGARIAGVVVRRGR
jgi:polysaccharide biosynthesis transport protein